MEVTGQLHALVALPHTHLLGGWVGFRSGLERSEEEEFCTAGNQTRAVHLVARKYTGRAVPTPDNTKKSKLNSMVWVRERTIHLCQNIVA
jgi:hypothetical protein